MSIFLAMEFLTLLEQKVAGTKSREVAQCFEKFSELKVAGTKSRGNLLSRTIQIDIQIVFKEISLYTSTL